MEEKTIYCPLIRKDIEEYDCFITGQVAEEIIRIDCVYGNEEIKRTENFRKRCLACKNHII